MSDDYTQLVNAIVREDSPRHFDPARWYLEHERQISLGIRRAPVAVALESAAFAAWLADHDPQVKAEALSLADVIVESEKPSNPEGDWTEYARGSAATVQRIRDRLRKQVS
jgi:hypothetical protein